MVFLRQLWIVGWLVAISGSLGAADAKQLARDAAKAARSGDYARAFQLYSQAAQQSPYAPYAALSRDMLSSALRADQLGLAAKAVEDDADALEGDLSDSISDEELEEARKPLPPIELIAKPGHFDLHSKAPVKQLWEDV